MTGVINAKGYYLEEKTAGLSTEVVFCYMSDRQERFGLLLFSDNSAERGHLVFPRREISCLIDL